MVGATSGARGAAAAAVTSILLLFAAAAWHRESRPGGDDGAGGLRPHSLSVRDAEGSAKTMQLAGDGGSGLADEIASMTSRLGNELENELRGYMSTSPRKITQLVPSGPPFTVNGKEGHYVACGDSVADGAFTEGINGDIAKAQRFHGKVGDIFVIRCPAHCGRYLAYSFVYGCGPYLDASAMCMAAILDGKIGYETGGDVAIKLVPPVPHYESCYRIVKRYMDVKGATQLSSARGRGPPQAAPYRKLWTTFPFTFAEWKKADGAMLLTQGEYHNNKDLTEYRTTCQYPETTTDIGCAGRRAFGIMNLRNDFNGYDPVISPVSGIYTGPLLVSIDAPRQSIFYTIDGSSPVGPSAEVPSDAALRYSGPFYINKSGKVTVRTISYSSDFFPGNSNEKSADYDVKEPPEGFPEEPPEVLVQKSLQPRVEGEHQQYLPGSITVLPPRNTNDIEVPNKGFVYQIFFAVDISMDVVKTKFAYPCGGADKNFASKINENGACEVSLPAGVWYIKAEGLMTGQAPCDGCDPYDRSDPSLFGPVLVSRKDGDALPPHFSPYTGSFFAITGEVDIATVQKMEVMFTLDGSDPATGSSTTAICGETFDYNSSTIESEYGPKGCAVTLPEGKWMICAVAKALQCDEICQMMNKSLSTTECAGPFYVVPPTDAPLVYPTWEEDNAPAKAAGDFEGAGKWLGNPAKLLLKQEDPEAQICFKLKEVIAGQGLTSKQWPKPKCGGTTTFVCGEDPPPGIFDGPDPLRADATVSSERVAQGCQVSLPDGEWAVAVVGDEIVKKCAPSEEKWSTAKCVPNPSPAPPPPGEAPTAPAEVPPPPSPEERPPPTVEAPDEASSPPPGETSAPSPGQEATTQGPSPAVEASGAAAPEGEAQQGAAAQEAEAAPGATAPEGEAQIDQAPQGAAPSAVAPYAPPTEAPAPPPGKETPEAEAGAPAVQAGDEPPEPAGAVADDEGQHPIVVGPIPNALPTATTPPVTPPPGETEPSQEERASEAAAQPGETPEPASEIIVTPMAPATSPAPDDPFHHTQPETSPAPDDPFPDAEAFIIVHGPPVEWLMETGANGGAMKLKPEFLPKLPERACTKNHNVCTMVRENCYDDPLKACSFTCMSQDGQACFDEGNMFSAIPDMINSHNGLSAPMELLPTVKYKCPAKIMQGVGWAVTKKDTGESTEGYQQIPYDKCIRLDKPEDACFCLFVSGDNPASRALFDSVMESG